MYTCTYIEISMIYNVLGSSWNQNKCARDFSNCLFQLVTAWETKTREYGRWLIKTYYITLTENWTLRHSFMHNFDYLSSRIGCDCSLPDVENMLKSFTIIALTKIFLKCLIAIKKNFFGFFLLSGFGFIKL